MGDLCKKLGRYDSAQVHYLGSLATCEKMGDGERVATALINMGEILIEQGRHKKAFEYYTQLVALYKKLGNHLNHETWILYQMAEICMGQGETDAAFDYYTKSLAGCEEEGYAPGAALCLAGMARISESLEKSDDALGYYTRALTKYEMVTDNDRRVMISKITATLNKVGDLLSNRGQGEQALEFHIRALATKLGRSN
jgi:tetratricopeptide (TPR) repeat protein